MLERDVGLPLSKHETDVHQYNQRLEDKFEKHFLNVLELLIADYLELLYSVFTISFLKFSVFLRIMFLSVTKPLKLHLDHHTTAKKR